MIAKRSTMADRHVGERLRALRQARGISQAELGKGIGVSFQQFQKYEHGQNRISAGHLFELAQLLEVKIECFFDGLDRTRVRPLEPRAKTASPSDLATLIGRITNTRVRKRVVDLIAAPADEVVCDGNVGRPQRKQESP